MLISFIKGSPALMINKEKTLVVSDLHIGNEFKLARSGLHFPSATKRMAQELMWLYKKNKAKRIILLGDIKESIGYPSREEFDAIATFFHEFRNVEIAIVKGNHDAHIAELLRRIGINFFPVKELILNDLALIHGNSMPSETAMKKKYIIAGHSHIAVDVNGKVEKGWLVAGLGEGAVKNYPYLNKHIKLVVMPAFNSLITGVNVYSETSWSTPLLRNRVFNPSTAITYDLNRKIRFKGAGI